VSSEGMWGDAMCGMYGMDWGAVAEAWDLSQCWTGSLEPHEDKAERWGRVLSRSWAKQRADGVWDR
jgi:hypothetical protein